MRAIPAAEMCRFTRAVVGVLLAVVFCLAHRARCAAAMRWRPEAEIGRRCAVWGAAPFREVNTAIALSN
jgi:hypothetical protein